MRTVRLTIPGVVYHLISRFVESRWFLSGDAERNQYLTLLGRAFSMSDWRCLSYALMSSHIHLAVLAGESRLETWSKRVHTPFATWINLRNERIGPVFVRGPKDHAVHPAGIGAVIAYIHNNPVRASVVARARASKWTSHRAYIGRASIPSWLDVERGMSLAGFGSSRSFEAWVDSAPEDPSRCDLRTLRREARIGQIDFGTPTVGGVTPILARSSAFIRVDPRWVVSIAAAIMGVDTIDVCSRRRSAAIVDARRIAVHAGLAFGIATSDIAGALGMSVSGASKIAHTRLDDERVIVCSQVIERVRTLTGAQVTTVPNHL
jgi:hypothetical protein